MEAIDLRNHLKDKDEDDNENYTNTVTIETKSNGYVMTTSFDDETEYSSVYCKDKDDLDLVKDIIDALGLNVSINEFTKTIN